MHRRPTTKWWHSGRGPAPRLGSRAGRYRLAGPCPAARRDLRHRRGGRPQLGPGDPRQLQEGVPEQGQGDQDPAGAGAGAAGQDQGPAGCRAAGRQPHHDRPVRRLPAHRGGPARQAVPDVRRHVSPRRFDRRGQGPPGRGRGLPDAVGGQQRRARLHLQPEEGAESAEDGRAAPGVGEGEPGQVPLCAAGEQRARPLHPGRHALHPEGQGSQGSRKRAGTRPGPS